MKKYILLLAFGAVAASCQKYQAGGNLDALKLKDNVVHYSDENAPKSTYVKKEDSGNVIKPKLTEPDLMMKKQAAPDVKPEMVK
jgi:hypothetical protein